MQTKSRFSRGLSFLLCLLLSLPVYVLGLSPRAVHAAAGEVNIQYTDYYIYMKGALGPGGPTADSSDFDWSSPDTMYGWKISSGANWLADGNVAWCVEPLVNYAMHTSSYTRQDLRAYFLKNPDLQHRLELINYYGYEAHKDGSEADWWTSVTQFMIWESVRKVDEVKATRSEHTPPVNGSWPLTAKYQASKAEIEEKIARYNTNVSFNSNTITIRPGQNEVLSDNSGVLKDMIILKNTTGADVRIDGHQLRITGTNSMKNGYIRFGKIPEKFIGAGFVYQSDKWQDLAVLKVSDPLYATLNITAAPAETEINVKKTWSNGQAAKDATVELFRNGKTIGQTAVLNEANHWSTSFGKLPVSESVGSTPYTYTVYERGENNKLIKINDKTYDVSYGGSQKDGFNVDNRYKAPPETELKVKKTWENPDGSELKAAELSKLSAQIELLRDGQPIGQTVTLNADNNWSASFGKFPVSKEWDSPAYIYTVREVGAQDGLIKYDKTWFEVSYSGDGKTGFSVKNHKPVTGMPVTVQKHDLLTGLDAAPEASLAGAQYAIVSRALDNPEAADFNVGDIVTSYETDTDGRFTTAELPFGTYDLVEQNPSTGYLKNETAVRFTISPEQKGTKVLAVFSQNSRNSESILAELNAQVDELNDVIRVNHAKRDPLPYFTEAKLKDDSKILTAERTGYGRIELHKHKDPNLNKGSGEREPEPDITFEILDKDGKRVDTLVTNADGFAASTLLQSGRRYTLHQVTTGKDISKIEDIHFTLKDKERKHYTLENAQRNFYLRLVKVDAQSKKQIPAANIAFKLKDEKGNYVTQTLHYPKTETIDTYRTAEDGTVTLPEPLLSGTYTVEEIKGPDGYFLPENGLVFTLNAEAAEAMKEGDIYVLNFTVENKAILGEIELSKKADIFKGWAKDENGVMRPVTEIGYLPGAEFIVTAEQDIVGKEGTVHYRAGQEVARLVTTADGPVKTKALPLGSYRLHEATVPYGYVGAEDQVVELTQEAPTKAVVLKQAEAFNALQRTNLTFDKSFQTSRWFKHELTAPGKTRFGLYNREELKFGDYTLPKDSLVGISGLTTKEKDGKAETDFESLEPIRKVTTVPVAGEFELRPIDTAETDEALRFSQDENGQYRYVAKVESSLTEPVKPEPVQAETTEDMTAEEKEAAIAKAETANKENETAYQIALEAYQAEQEKIKTYETAKTILQTDEQGQLQIQDLPEGTYVLTSTKVPEGIEPIRKETVVKADTPKTEITVTQDKVELLPPSEQQIGAVVKQTIYLANFEGLLPGAYYIRELETGEAYELAKDGPVQIEYKPQGGASETQHSETRIENRLIDASIEVVKVSANTQKPLEGAEFKLYAVHEDGSRIEIGKYLTDKTGRIKIQGLEVGEYYLEEIKAPEGYYINKDGYPIKITKEQKEGKVEAENDKIPEIGTQAAFEDGKKENLPEPQMLVIDQVHYKDLIIGRSYEIKGMLVDRDNPSIVIATATRTFVADNTEGTVEIRFSFDGSLLAGKTLVVFEDLYHKGRLYASHKELMDRNQTVYIPKIGTTATTPYGGKELLAAENATLIDTVSYSNLIPGKEYKMLGQLIRKADGTVITTAEQVFTASESGSGTVSMTFTFNASELGGEDVVVFEELYSGDKKIAVHADIEDKGQTVHIVPKPRIPETGEHSRWPFGAFAFASLLSVTLYVRRRRAINA